MKRISIQTPMHETIGVGMLLALVGGFLDAYTYLFRGGVFANAQTGNMVLMAISGAKGEFGRMGYYLLPVLAFFLGVLVTEWVKRRFSGAQFITWQHVIILLEVALMAAVGFLPKAAPDAAVNITISFICSMQVHSFRATKGLPYATTMCTGNLRSAAEAAASFFSTRDRNAGRAALRYLGIIGAFCLGAAMGALLVNRFAGRAIWACCALLLLVFGLLAVKK